MTTDKFEAGETTSAKVAEGSGSVDDEPEDVFTELTMKQKSKYLAQPAAWTYLVASYTVKAFGLIKRHTGYPLKAWGVVQEKFCATDVEANYPEMEKEFQTSKLEGTLCDPELWFNDLDPFNVRLGRISRDLDKSELPLKLTLWPTCRRPMTQ